MRALAIALGPLLLAGCATTNSGALPHGARYVAMGSSFAAGAGIGPLKEGTPARCGRTTNNYATLLATRLGLALDDQTCGGATTAHVNGAWNELPAQIDAVTSDTRLVTVTIGGNDLNYAAFLFASTCDPAKGMTIEGRTIPCFKAAAPTPAAYASAEEGLRAIARGVRERAPAARLVFVQYVTLVPERPCEGTVMAPDAAAQAREIGTRLAAITAKVARETGSLLLPTDELSRGHTSCDAVPYSIGFPRDFDGKGGTPWHPTAAGHAVIAEALAALLSR